MSDAECTRCGHYYRCSKCNLEVLGDYLRQLHFDTRKCVRCGWVDDADKFSEHRSGGYVCDECTPDDLSEDGASGCGASAVGASEAEDPLESVDGVDATGDANGAGARAAGEDDTAGGRDANGGEDAATRHATRRSASGSP